MNLVVLGLIIAVAANLDNLGIGLAYGIRKVCISHKANALIALASFAAALISAEAGKAACLYISPSTGHMIGAALIAGVGVWVLIAPAPEVACSRQIGTCEALLLGLALSINAIAGFDAGAAGIPPYAEAAAVGLFSFITVGTGVYIGRRCASESLGRYSTLVSGALLIFIGVGQFLA